MQRFNNKRTKQEKQYDRAVEVINNLGGFCLQINAPIIKDKKQPADHLFHCNNKSIVFDCKETKRKRFFFSYLKNKNNQIGGLSRALNNNYNYAGFVIRFTHIENLEFKDFFMPITQYLELKKKGIKSVLPADLIEFDIYKILGIE